MRNMMGLVFHAEIASSGWSEEHSDSSRQHQR
jgi:hypothetical protein